MGSNIIKNCGKMSWDEILVNQARWMKKLQALSDSTAPSPCWCPIKESRSGIALKNLPQLQSLSGATTSNSPQAVDDAQKSPNRAPVPSATAGKLTPSQLKPDYPEISSTESEMMEQGRLCSIERHWVLLGVQGSRPTRIPGEVAVETSTTDYHFFKSLKAEYAKHRGRIRLWFSLWQLEYFEFAEVSSSIEISFVAPLIHKYIVPKAHAQAHGARAIRSSTATWGI